MPFSCGFSTGFSNGFAVCAPVTAAPRTHKPTPIQLAAAPDLLLQKRPPLREVVLAGVPAHAHGSTSRPLLVIELSLSGRATITRCRAHATLAVQDNLVPLAARTRASATQTARGYMVMDEPEEEWLLLGSLAEL